MAWCFFSPRQVGIAENGDPAGCQCRHAVHRIDDARHVLAGQAVEDVERDGTDAGGLRVARASLARRRLTRLRRRCQVRRPMAGKSFVDTLISEVIGEIAWRPARPVSDALGIGGEAEALVDPPHQAREILRAEARRRAAAPVQMGERDAAGQVVGNEAEPRARVCA
ncbi:MAG: hypothetical protein R3D25_12875 [Geminicoccaceae bacterium]